MVTSVNGGATRTSRTPRVGLQTILFTPDKRAAARESSRVRTVQRVRVVCDLRFQVFYCGATEQVVALINERRVLSKPAQVCPAA